MIGRVEIKPASFIQPLSSWNYDKVILTIIVII